MKRRLEEKIQAKAKKFISKYHLEIFKHEKEKEIFDKRTTLDPESSEHIKPETWNLSDQFNPFIVRSKSDLYAHTLNEKIKNEEYQPLPALELTIDKTGSGTRNITVFSVTDSAVASFFFEKLMEKNDQYFSSSCVAYRGNVNAHTAINGLNQYLKPTSNLFLLKYDFKDYFQNIEHDYLRQVLQSHFQLNSREFFVLEKFIKYRKSFSTDSFNSNNFSTNIKGVPQGNSISLFCANVACHELDKDLHRISSKYVRYADDIIILCEKYNQAKSCVDKILEFENESGIPLNREKSKGIRKLEKNITNSVKSINCFNFLGHQFNLPEKNTVNDRKNITFSSNKKTEIKDNISTRIYRHLIYHPRRYNFTDNRLHEGTDWDLLRCLKSIRRYLYGSLTEEKITSALDNDDEKLAMNQSLFSFYPEINDPSTLKELDGWLIDVLLRALRERQKLLEEIHGIDYEPPSRFDLKTGDWYQAELDKESQVPSFFKGWLYVKKCTLIHNMLHFPSPYY
jgi:hypothetical protein